MSRQIDHFDIGGHFFVNEPLRIDLSGQSVHHYYLILINQKIKILAVSKCHFSKIRAQFFAF